MRHDITKRYRPLAGPFTGEEVILMTSACDYLRKTGARIVTHPERHGVTIFRLRSECETIEETARRISRRRV